MGGDGLVEVMDGRREVEVKQGRAGQGRAGGWAVVRFGR
jgi:hypothetical protein